MFVSARRTRFDQTALLVDVLRKAGPSRWIDRDITKRFAAVAEVVIKATVEVCRVIVEITIHLDFAFDLFAELDLVP